VRKESTKVQRKTKSFREGRRMERTEKNKEKRIRPYAYNIHV